jgi:cytochrome c-type biogenesis protein CcmH/NrfG
MESWVNLAAMYVQMKRGEEALVTTRTAVRIVGSKVSLLHLMAHAMVQVGRWQDAKNVWEDILQAVPDHRDSHLSLAEICAQTGKTQEALRHLNAAEKALPLEPNYQEMKRQIQSQIASLP